MKFDWIEAIVGINEEVCLDLYQENHMTIIQMFFIINLHGSFSLSQIAQGSTHCFGMFIEFYKFMTQDNHLSYVKGLYWLQFICFAS